nr:hypothetical protein [Roseobacter sp. WL0113]
MSCHAIPKVGPTSCSTGRFQAIRTKCDACSPPRSPKLWQGSGEIQGHLIGGCAEALEMLKGTDLWPSLRYWDGAILFYETSEEAPSLFLVMRWMRNFGAQGILNRIAGMIVGRPGGVPAERQDDYGAAIANVLAEYGADTMPLITGMDSYHTDPMLVLPHGTIAEINCGDVSLLIVEASVAVSPGIESETA